MIVNRSNLADVLGVALTTVDTYRRQGMPIAQEGSQGKEFQFDTKEVIEWLITLKVGGGEGGKVSTYEMSRAREKAATARMKELQLEEMEGRMLDVDDIMAPIEEQYGVVKSRVQAIPGRMAQTLAPELSAAAVERMLKAEINQALAELSTDAIN